MSNTTDAPKKLSPGLKPKTDEQLAELRSRKQHRKQMGRIRRTQQFCIAYVRYNFNASKAAQSIGYPVGSSRARGYEYTLRPEFKRFMELFMDEQIKDIGLTYEYKLDRLKKILDLSMTDIEIKNHSAALGAIAEANKMQGHYAAEQRQIDVKVDVELNKLEDMVKKYEKDV